MSGSRCSASNLGSDPAEVESIIKANEITWPQALLRDRGADPIVLDYAVAAAVPDLPDRPGRQPDRQGPPGRAAREGRGRVAGPKIRKLLGKTPVVTTVVRPWFGRAQPPTSHVSAIRVRIGLTPEVGGRSSRPNHALTRSSSFCGKLAILDKIVSSDRPLPLPGLE